LTTGCGSSWMRQTPQSHTQRRRQGRCVDGGRGEGRQGHCVLYGCGCDRSSSSSSSACRGATGRASGGALDNGLVTAPTGSPDSDALCLGVVGWHGRRAARVARAAAALTSRSHFHGCAR
jgi:hypothetical protein